MTYETLTYEIADAVATITLNRPSAYNALDLTLARELYHAALDADEDRAVRCVVVTGAGNAFCAGGDVKSFHENAGRVGILVKQLTTYLHGAVSRLARSPKPVIMAVNGIAAGGGMSLALAGDLVVAAESAKFTMAYSKIAASPDGSSTYFLPRMIGLRRALELHFTNRTLSAKEAMEWGLVNRVYPDAEFRSRDRRVRARARAGADARVRPREAPLPPVDAGEPRDADGARSAGDRAERRDRGFRERRGGVRAEEAGAVRRALGATPPGSRPLSRPGPTTSSG